MNKINITSKDLNLLPVLMAIFNERNLSKASLRLNLTQPALSHALARLRAEFGDQLFVRGSKGMVPTPHAISIMEKLKDTISQLENLYADNHKLDLLKESRRIVIATTEYAEVVIMSNRLKQMYSISPLLQFHFKSAAGVLPKSELESGAIDLALAGYFGDLPEGYFQQRIMTDDFVTAAPKNHKIFNSSKVDLRTFAGYRHCLISPHGDLKGRVDEELRKAKLSRLVQVSTASFLSPAWFIQDLDLVITAPRSLLMAYSQYFPIQMIECPLKLPKLDVYQVWHERTNKSPFHKWLRQQFANSHQNI